jgi:hypothetical protein
MEYKKAAFALFLGLGILSSPGKLNHCSESIIIYRHHQNFWGTPGTHQRHRDHYPDGIRPLKEPEIYEI